MLPAEHKSARLSAPLRPLRLPSQGRCQICLKRAWRQIDKRQLYPHSLWHMLRISLTNITRHGLTHGHGFYCESAIPTGQYLINHEVRDEAVQDTHA